MAQTNAPKWRKVVISAAVGAALGMLGMMALVPLFESGALGSVDPSELVAGAVGLIYGLIGLCIGAGLAHPSMGAHFLNVEDADELRDQRRMLAYAAAGMVALGTALIMLALAGPGGAIPRVTALVGALALFAASIPLTLLQWRHMDELMRRLSTEAGNLAFLLMLVGGGGWAMLAHLDFAPPPAPIDWLTMFLGLALAASFITTGRRGLLMPR